MTRVRPGLVLALVVLVLAATLTALTVWRDGAAVVSQAAPPGAGGTVPVSSAALVCPDASALGAGSTTDVTLVAPPLDVLTGADEGAAGSGDAAGSPATARPLEVGAAPLVTLDAQGPAVAASVEADDIGPVEVRAVGGLAPGLTASQVTTAAEGDVTGVSGAVCAEPTTASWFIGVGTEIGHRPQLTVVNIEPAVAELDIVLHGASGALDLAALRDIAVPSGAAETFDLDALAPDLSELAIEVRVRSGRVAAAVRDSYVEGLTSLGLDWVPATAPGTRVVVPVPGGAGGRLLQLVAPGDLDARVGVRLLTATGAIVPEGLEEIELAAGAVRSVDLAAVLDEGAASVELTAEVPVVAGVRVSGGGEEQRDLAYAAGATPLTGPAVLAGARSGNGWSGRLTLSADDGGAGRAPAAPLPVPEATGEPTDSATPAGSAAPTPTGTPGAPSPARVRLSYLDAATGDVVASVDTDLAPGSSVELALVAADVELPERFSVVVTPLEGTLYGSWRLDREGGADAGFTVLVVSSPRLEVDVPFVRHDLSTGLRAG